MSRMHAIKSKSQIKHNLLNALRKSHLMSYVPLASGGGITKDRAEKSHFICPDNPSVVLQMSPAFMRGPEHFCPRIPVHGPLSTDPITVEMLPSNTIVWNFVWNDPLKNSK